MSQPSPAAHAIRDAASKVRQGELWRVGTLAGRQVMIDGVQVLGTQAPAIANPEGGSVIDQPARDALIAVLEMLRMHGMIAN